MLFESSEKIRGSKGLLAHHVWNHSKDIQQVESDLKEGVVSTLPIANIRGNCPSSRQLLIAPEATADSFKFGCLHCIHLPPKDVGLERPIEELSVN